MDEDLSTYNGDVIHDMWVDTDYDEHTGELHYVEDDAEIDNEIDNE